MKVKIKKIYKCDFLVVGTGIAGLIASERALKKGKNVCLVTNKKLCSGASYFPLKGTLGIQVTKNEEDYEKYYEDIVKMGNGMENPELIKLYISNIRDSLFLLNKIGFKPWLRQDSRPACFAKYSRDIYLINNWKEASNRCKQKLKNSKKLNIVEDSTLIKIITKNNRTVGAIFQQNKDFIFIKSEVIVLATGGVASNYKNSLYPEGINGIGHIVALDAGASAQNMEFIQFIPAFLKPRYNVLYGEHTAKYCLGMYDINKNLILPGINDKDYKEIWEERSSYAPFSVDFKSHIIDLKIPNEGVILKYSKKLYENREEFYTVYLNWLKNEMRIDLLEDETLITHFAHSCNGGIKINENAQTELAGLYAVGEVASIIEGANRLGGNSLGGSLVFANRAIIDGLKYIQRNKKIRINLSEIELEFNKWLDKISISNKTNILDKKIVVKKLKELTSENLGIVRNREKVETLLKELETLKSDYSIKKNLNRGSLEVYLMIESIKMLALSILNREESRGAHYREDFPNISKNIIKLKIKRENNQFLINKIKINATI